MMTLEQRSDRLGALVIPGQRARLPDHVPWL
jgi:hypothetical protein